MAWLCCCFVVVVVAAAAAADLGFVLVLLWVLLLFWGC